MPSSTRVVASARPSARRPSSGRAGQLRIALDSVQQRGREPRADLEPGRREVLGQDRRRRAVVGPDVVDRRFPAGALRVVVDHQVDVLQPQRDRLAEHVRLHVDQRDAVELVELIGFDRAHLEAERLDHRDVLGPLRLAERDERRGRRFAP
jgi:hypothetical protein